ncbi:MAG: alpha-L-glutamate ligase-like protein [Thermodesulfobacteriota bacterium]|nr:alpha-L-glutamate ligase-like protein [Thermodesulfobacteriota bacterium]
MYFTTPGKLKKAGIVGMNRRNVVLIAENNPRHLYPRVDDKLQTKILAQKAGIAVPKLFGVARYQYHVKQLHSFLADYDSFVMKPSKGSGGKGILVITGRNGDYYIKPNGSKITEIDVRRHASNTLSGLFSLGGKPDVAMIEDLVDFSDVFDGFSFEGVPDIRIIVYKGYPVMAMTRLSTSESDGKANLHQGAVGVGIDINSGKALNAVQHGRPVENHPDTGKDLSTFFVPDWQVFLELAAQCYEITELGYLGADVVLDKAKGPQILELNARPGLAIQVANGAGMQPRVDRVEGEVHKGRDYKKRVAFSMEHFGR